LIAELHPRGVVPGVSQHSSSVLRGGSTWSRREHLVVRRLHDAAVCLVAVSGGGSCASVRPVTPHEYTTQRSVLTRLIVCSQCFSTCVWKASQPVRKVGTKDGSTRTTGTTSCTGCFKKHGPLQQPCSNCIPAESSSSRCNTSWHALTAATAPSASN
jgi:hypothetical protein